MERMRVTKQLVLYPKPLYSLVSSTSLTVFFQNVRNYITNKIDIENTFGIRDVDLICLNETHLSDTPRDVRLLPNLIAVHNTKGGLLISAKNIPFLIQSNTNNDIDIIKFRYCNILYIFLYRHCHMKRSYFENVIKNYLLGHEHECIIIMGDFNYKYTNESIGNECSFLHRLGFNQFINFPTNTMSKNTIDHVWTNSKYTTISTTFLQTYYSDHYPIILSISM